MRFIPTPYFGFMTLRFRRPEDRPNLSFLSPIYSDLVGDPCKNIRPVYFDT